MKQDTWVRVPVPCVCGSTKFTIQRVMRGVMTQHLDGEVLTEPEMTAQYLGRVTSVFCTDCGERARYSNKASNRAMYPAAPGGSQ